MASFQLNISFTQRIICLKNIALSLAQCEQFKAKNVIDPNSSKSESFGRISSENHLKKLLGQGLLKATQPLMLISVRNTIANLRCVAYLQGIEKIISVNEEIITDRRPYHILGQRKDGKLVMDLFRVGYDSLNDYRWFISGVPVIWEDGYKKDIFLRMISEAADHSHVWRIPRGNHPAATKKTRQQWYELHEIFTQTLSEDHKKAANLLNTYAQKHGLERERDYIHNILGVNKSGNLCQIIGHGLLEDLGSNMKKVYDIRHAICVDNGGSIEVIYYPKGTQGISLQLVALPNFRPLGTAYLGIELKDSSFNVIPEKV